MPQVASTPYRIKTQQRYLTKGEEKLVATDKLYSLKELLGYSTMQGLLIITDIKEGTKYIFQAKEKVTKNKLKEQDAI